ncbi:MAG: hypothetical protein Q9200_007297 [Gallowayella weberi]
MLFLLTFALAVWFATASAQNINISEVPTCAVNNAAIQSAVIVPTNGPVAVFTGRPLFTRTCTTPEFAMVTMNGGGVLEYPGWSIHTSSIGNNVPCVSTLATPLAAPSATGLRKRAPVSVIVTSQLYTLKYALKPKKSGLSTGAKAGIAVGAAVAVIFGALLVAFIIHKRKLRSRGLSEGTIIGDGSFYGPTNKRSGTFSHAGSQPGQPSELPSPTVIPQGVPMNGGFWLPLEPQSEPPRPPVPMQELPASTHMHEHHPMFQPSDSAQEELPPVPTIKVGDDPHLSAGLVSPLEEPGRK